MATFADAVRDAVASLYGGASKSDVPEAAHAELDFAVDPQRLAEAEEVAQVADAFARAEVWPPSNGKGLGVYGPNLIKPLGTQLGKKLAKASEDQIALILDGVGSALAFGYLGFLALEPDNPWSYQPGQDPEHIWRLAVANFRADGIRGLGVPAPVVANVERFGQDTLSEALQASGVLGWRKGRTGLLGRYYAHAGAFMRAGQTDCPMPAEIAASADLLGQFWPYGDFTREP